MSRGSCWAVLVVWTRGWFHPSGVPGLSLAMERPGWVCQVLGSAQQQDADVRG